MRFLPLLSARLDPAPWIPFRNLELSWEGELHPGWERAVREGLGVHALHLPARPWGEPRVVEICEALRVPLGVDFLITPTAAPRDRVESAHFLGALETLLEALQGRGVKLALRPAPGAGPALVTLLKEMRCDAVGYCWDAGVGADLELLSDRLFCAVGKAQDDLTGLRRLGYRWNVAVPATDPESAMGVLAGLGAANPMIYFPEVTP